MSCLKIKDNVDLKELENFGFEKDIFNDYYIMGEEHYLIISVNSDDRLIIFNTGDISEYTDISILVDLIQAGLVEKVVE